MSTREEITILSKAAASRGETLTAESVVEAAKNATTYPSLHEQIWAVADADLVAEARLARAHRLIIRLTVVTDDGTTVRAFMHTREEKGYRPVSSLATNVSLASIKLAELTADIGRARHRLAGFKSILPAEITDEIDAALSRADDMIKRATASTSQTAAA